MSTQTVTIQLPEHLYRSASQLARAAKRPLADIVRDSLAHALPPLDDVDPAEAEELAGLSQLSDAELWRAAQSNLPPEQQSRLDALLLAQSAGELDEAGLEQLRKLQNEYGRLLVRQSHAWLLLARRGYKVPLQNG
ncbi:MAG TPA: hypothetical protein ENK32_12880 [Anaerolineae bacterium]|nr:hypothetical protein [Anaerolineae bacterium]